MVFVNLQSRVRLRIQNQEIWPLEGQEKGVYRPFFHYSWTHLDPSRRWSRIGLLRSTVGIPLRDLPQRFQIPLHQEPSNLIQIGGNNTCSNGSCKSPSAALGENPVSLMMLQTVNPGFNQNMLLAYLLEFRRGRALSIHLVETALFRKDQMQQQSLDGLQILLGRETTDETEGIDLRMVFQDVLYRIFGNVYIDFHHKIKPSGL